MPDSSVAITAGSGTSIDTRTEATNSEHRQVVVVGDPSTNAGVVAVLNAAPSSTDYGAVVRTAGNTQVVGELAHDAVDSGNPVKIGGIADSDLQPAVADGDRTQAWFDRHGRQHVRVGNQSAAGNVLTAIHVPSANTVATASIAAGGAGVRNVCTGLTAVIAATATAPTAVNVIVNLIDGATGGTTFLWRMTLSLPATAGETRGVTRSGLWLPGTTNTALTLEFSAAGGANTIESVSLEGVRITE